MSWFDYPGDYSWQVSSNGGDVTFKDHPLQLTFVMNFKIFKIQKIQKFFWECTHLHLNSTKYIDYPKYLLKCSWEYKCVFYLLSNAICTHTLRSPKLGHNYCGLGFSFLSEINIEISHFELNSAKKNRYLDCKLLFLCQFWLCFIWITWIFDFENHQTSNLFKFMSFIYKLEYLECISWPLGCPLFTAIDWLGRSILGIKRITNSRPFNQLSNLKNRMFDMKPKCNFDKWQHVLRILNGPWYITWFPDSRDMALEI